MQVTTQSPINIELHRSGGCVITGRLDYWIPSQSDWEPAGSSVFQQVTAKVESQSTTLPIGNYTVVAKFYIEESIDGVYEFALLVNGQPICKKSGDVNTTSSQHDSATFKTQFILQVQ